MGDLPSTLFARLDLTTKALERIDEEALDMVRLQALGLGAFHVDANFLHPSSWHRVVSQCPARQKIKQMLLVDGTIDA